MQPRHATQCWRDGLHARTYSHTHTHTSAATADFLGNNAGISWCARYGDGYRRFDARARSDDSYAETSRRIAAAARVAVRGTRCVAARARAHTFDARELLLCQLVDIYTYTYVLLRLPHHCRRNVLPAVVI